MASDGFRGVQGRPVEVKTNSFVITRLPTKKFFHFDVVLYKLEFHRLDAMGAPNRKEVGTTKRYMDIINKMHDTNPQEFDTRPCYDGKRNMFSLKRHRNASFIVKMLNHDTKGVYEVQISLVNEIPPGLLQSLIAPGSHNIDTTVQKRDRMKKDAPNIPLNPNAAAVTLLQVIVTQAPHIQHKFSMHARAFYIQAKATDLSGALISMPGFFQSVRPTLGRYLINVDTTTAAFYRPGWLLDVAQRFFGVHTPMDVVRACENRARFSELRMFLRGLNVNVIPNATDYNRPPPPDDTYRLLKITDIKPNAGNIMFLSNNREVSVRDYWQDTHNTIIRYPNLFGVSTGRGSVFPAEKCWVSPGQRYSRKLSPQDMRTFLTKSVSRPDARISAIEAAVVGSDLNYAKSSWMYDAGLEIDPRPLHIRGREIPPPGVGYGARSSLQISEGKWNIVDQKFLEPRQILAMGVVVFDPRCDRPRVQEFVQRLITNMRRLGMNFQAPPIQYHEGNQHKPEESLSAAAMGASKHLGPDKEGKSQRPQMVLVVLPAEAEQIRRVVKYYGDVEYGIPTQCVRRGKYDAASPKALDQYCNNVALKINSKLGGTNNAFLYQALGDALHHTMVVGCDISHPAPGVRNRPSIAGLVASVDVNYAKYSAHVRCQDPRQEVIEDLAGMLIDAIESFRAAQKGAIPQKIVIYRDGVSEGEYARVVDREIGSIQERLQKQVKDPRYLPKIAFIVVGKRHHVRFFPKDRFSGDNKGNCRPGLVVDSEIVHSRWPNFYLQSHAGIIGTSRPSHYVVLRNDPGWSPDQLQAISYALCHIYAPATRSVSIPAPVYYADKLCTHASFQFKPGDGAHYDDETSGVGTHDDNVFNLETWQSRLRPAHELVKNQMYFV
ncbi:Piwi-domain-containing protein [Trametopsis cervina]|nr:Piwi-domain-containing protein [Trametopsis cervina]